MVKPTCRECHGAHFPSEPCERPADRLPSLPPTATTTTRDILFSWALAGGIALGALVAGAAEALIDGAGILAGSLAALLVWAGCFAWGWWRDRRAERKARAEDAAAAERWRTLLASGAVGDLAGLYRAIEEGARETVGQCGGIVAVGPDGSLWTWDDRIWVWHRTYRDGVSARVTPRGEYRFTCGRDFTQSEAITVEEAKSECDALAAQAVARQTPTPAEGDDPHV